MDLKNIKIAVVSDDGKTISAHFGRARYYEVFTVEEGVIKHQERREKTGHHTFSEHEEPHHHGESHGMDETSQRKHESMIASIPDCQVLLARGMGMGAYQNLIDHNIKPILTEIETIREAVQAVITGTIVHREQRLH
jgi:predicted Fe-Mo cluster-binding NifX family protein